MGRYIGSKKEVWGLELSGHGFSDFMASEFGDPLRSDMVGDLPKTPPTQSWSLPLQPTAKNPQLQSQNLPGLGSRFRV